MTNRTATGRLPQKAGTQVRLLWSDGIDRTACAKKQNRLGGSKGKRHQQLSPENRSLLNSLSMPFDTLSKAVENKVICSAW